MILYEKDKLFNIKKIIYMHIITEISGKNKKWNYKPVFFFFLVFRFINRKI